jgi:ATP-dependent helicase HrpB
VIGWNVRRFRDLVLDRKRVNEVSEEAAADLLGREVVGGRARLKHWDHAVEQYLLRIAHVRSHCPELELPDLAGTAREELAMRVCAGARSLKEIKERPVLPVIKSWLTAEQRKAVETLAPERVQLPDGPRIKLVYQPDGPPHLSARIQDLYGVKSTVKLPRSDTPVLIHVLAPNHRPVQVTPDLTTFWRETYPKVKSEFQRKYPKHDWR